MKSKSWKSKPLALVAVATLAASLPSVQGFAKTATATSSSSRPYEVILPQLSRPLHSPLHSQVSDDNVLLEELFEARRLDFGRDLAQEFHEEQQSRQHQEELLQETRRQRRQWVDEQGNNETSTSMSASAGLFSSSAPVVSSVPTPARLRMEKEAEESQSAAAPDFSWNPWVAASGAPFSFNVARPTITSTKEQDNNGDNLLLIMTATMTAYATSDSWYPSQEDHAPPLQPILCISIGIFLAGYMVWMSNSEEFLLHTIESMWETTASTMTLDSLVSSEVLKGAALPSL